MIKALYFLFVLSGAAGLIYESIWTRYLGLFVGHGAYAQIIVLVIFLGGMSLGAVLISRRSERLTQPLYGYVAVEFAAGCIGLFFHDIFQFVTNWAYAGIYPALAGSKALVLAKWAIAGSLILPQSILLGMTFPLITAGVLRLSSRRPGRVLSMLYFSNSLGAAVGVLVAGFYLVNLAGLPGTLLTAAILNLLVAAATIGVIVRARGSEAGQTRAQAAPASTTLAQSPASLSLERLLLFTALGTAIASFLYEIAWIRMLALVVGSATHSFELMLSAFILGLALGALWIRRRADRSVDSIRSLGLVQWCMGLLALATLPLYVSSFEWISSLLSTFARNDAGYTGFTIAKYAVCLVIMLPATFCAGMTLPLITRTLMANGSGERAIGAVYAWNTMGSILGVMLGGLVLLPVIGLKPMLIVAAVVDTGIGVLLLHKAGASSPKVRYLVPAALGIAAGFMALIAGLVRLDTNLLASGVYRTGEMLQPNDRDMLFYRDGRTATVTVTRTKPAGWITLATNGKPDASLQPTWYQPCSSTTAPVPMTLDAGAQTLIPLVTLAHAPQAKTAAVIGQGSGMSSHLLLGSPTLRELVTIEIEPQMIAGSRLFYPANKRSFDDPRSQIVIDDAKSYFASEHRRYDVIVSEPSNPWVSGVSGLFTTEFYSRVKNYLNPDGVFGQWIHVYELDDGLVLSVLAALHQNFASYDVYQVSYGDLLIVASNRPRLSAPDWSVFQYPMLRKDLCRFVALTPEVLGGLRIAGRDELGTLLEAYGANSDFYPTLDLGAERRRFRRDFAVGFPTLSAEWFNVLASLKGTRTAPGGEAIPALPEVPRVRVRSLGALLRSRKFLAPTDSAFGPVSRDAMYRWNQWQAGVGSDQPPGNWEVWLEQANAIDQLRNGGTAGVADESFYAGLSRVMDRYKAPQVVRDVVMFRHAIATWQFKDAVDAGERLLPVVTSQRRWIGADEFRDGLVLAKLHLRDAAGAQRRFYQLAPLSTRKPADLRSQLLEAYVTTAAQSQPNVAQR
jgi:spermidine synthase